MYDETKFLKDSDSWFLIVSPEQSAEIIWQEDKYESFDTLDKTFISYWRPIGGRECTTKP